MTSEEIKKILTLHFKVQNLSELNKTLKTEEALKTKFAMRGKTLGHLGFTAPIKAVTPEGVKIVDGKRNRLVRFADIETFKKAEPREKRAKPVKAVVTPVKLDAKKSKDKSAAKDGTAKKPAGVSQSLFIPPSKSR